jgi:hypothetical protein
MENANQISKAVVSHFKDEFNEECKMGKNDTSKIKRVSPRFALEGFAIYEDYKIVGVKKDAPQWVHDEFSAWSKSEAARKNSTMK